MKLKLLIRGLPEVKVHGSKELVITGMSADSRRVGPGYLFIARRGETYDGTEYIQDAIDAGATAVLTDLYDPTLTVTQVICPDPAAAIAPLAALFFGNPSQALFSVGITGTNGKTTSAYLIKHLLDPCGLLGTIEYIVGDRKYQATHTTPEVINVQRMLREMVQSRCRAVVMEVTSHGLAQKRVAEVGFDVAVFTNLSQDHLDYHGTMEAYAAAKGLLFQSLSPTATAVVNHDDPWLGAILKDCRAEVFSFGTTPEADLWVSEIATDLQNGSGCLVHHGEEAALLRTPLIGDFNVYNALAALAVGIVHGGELQTLVERLADTPQIPGRLERVSEDPHPAVYIDFAHTPDALERVLETLRPLVPGRLITVFGCGGDRDRDKRPLMGEVAARFSDLPIVTSDNPRSEDPESICRQILTGMPERTEGETVLCEPDRRKAILLAIAMAKPDDCVLIAGKGHESSQIIGHRTIPFDDRQVAREVMEGLATKELTH